MFGVVKDIKPLSSDETQGPWQSVWSLQMMILVFTLGFLWAHMDKRAHLPHKTKNWGRWKEMAICNKAMVFCNFSLHGHCIAEEYAYKSEQKNHRNEWDDKRKCIVAVIRPRFSLLLGPQSITLHYHCWYSKPLPMPVKWVYWAISCQYLELVIHRKKRRKLGEHIMALRRHYAFSHSI